MTFASPLCLPRPLATAFFPRPPLRESSPATLVAPLEVVRLELSLASPFVLLSPAIRHVLPVAPIVSHEIFTARIFHPEVFLG